MLDSAVESRQGAKDAKKRVQLKPMAPRFGTPTCSRLAGPKAGGRAPARCRQDGLGGASSHSFLKNLGALGALTVQIRCLGS
jgi:hypothetical protein